MTEQVFSKWAFEHSQHHHCAAGGGGQGEGLSVRECVCVGELGLCVPFLPQAEPFASRGRGQHVTVCIHVSMHMWVHNMRRCEKVLYIFQLLLVITH